MYIDYDVADRIATITLNRPEAANAQNPELLDELDAAWSRAAADSEVSVIVLRANGKHFSAGHDLKGGGPVPDKITLEFIIEHEAKRYLEYTLRWRSQLETGSENGSPELRLTIFLNQCYASRFNIIKAKYGANIFPVSHMPRKYNSTI